MLNFYVSVLTDGQWLGELVVCFDEADYNLDSHSRIKEVVFDLFGISAFSVESVESSRGLWRL